MWCVGTVLAAQNQCMLCCADNVRCLSILASAPVLLLPQHVGMLVLSFLHLQEECKQEPEALGINQASLLHVNGSWDSTPV